MPQKTSKVLAEKVADIATESLMLYNKSVGTNFTTADDYDSTGTPDETFLNKNFFPVLQKNSLLKFTGGNKYQKFAKEVPNASALTSEYVIADAVPKNLNLTQPILDTFSLNYGKTITKVYRSGQRKVLSYALDNNEIRDNFRTIAEVVNYATGIHLKRIDDIDYNEELEFNTVNVLYGLKNCADNRVATSKDDLINKIYNSLINVQSKSVKHNEAAIMTNNMVLTNRVKSKLEDMIIICTDDTKVFLLKSVIAQLFNAKGLDFSSKIFSTETLGGMWLVTEDTTITDQTTVEYFNNVGNYHLRTNTIIKENDILPFDPTKFGSDFTTENCQEIKPENEDLFALVIDKNAFKYNQTTNNMLVLGAINDQTNSRSCSLHYRSSKNVSPFYNKIAIMSQEDYDKYHPER